jgi:hypothetical protein
MVAVADEHAHAMALADETFLFCPLNTEQQMELN